MIILESYSDHILFQRQIIITLQLRLQYLALTVEQLL